METPAGDVEGSVGTNGRQEAQYDEASLFHLTDARLHRGSRAPAGFHDASEIASYPNSTL